MKKALLLYALSATLIALFALSCCQHHRLATQRLTADRRALVERLDTAHRSLDHQRASVEVLRLRCREYERLHQADAEQIRALGIRLRRVETTAVQVAATQLETTLPLRDTLLRLHDTLPLFDTLRRFSWHDPWVRIEGVLHRDSIRCCVQSVDTLRQVIHRVPRRFLFFRWGTKAIRQEIHSSNPHTQLVYTDFVVIER